MNEHPFRVVPAGPAAAVPPCDDAALLTAREAELRQLRRLIADQESRLHYLHGRCTSLQACWSSLQCRWASLQGRLHLLQSERDRLQQVEQQLRAELAEYQHGLAGTTLRALKWTRHRVAPRGSRRERLLLLTKRAAKAARREGPVGFVRKAVAKVVRKVVPATAPPPSEAESAIGRGRAAPSQPTPVVPLHAAVCPDASAPPVPPLDALERALLAEIVSLSAPVVSGEKPAVDVIIPLNRGSAETLRCLRSVLTATSRTPFQVVVINDACPDLVLAYCLRQLAGRRLIALLENAVRLGPIGAINRGLAQHFDRDVILLHPETEVHGNWIDRLAEAAYSDRNVATVAPLSRNLPFFRLHPFGQALATKITAAAIDDACSRTNRGQYLDMPAGVGACLFLRRDGLAPSGLLPDEPGGEVAADDEFRVADTLPGWRHLLATSTYVERQGAAPPLGTQGPESEKVLRAFAALHTPAETQSRASRPAMLFLCHGLGGGTVRHVFDMALRLEAEGIAGLVLGVAGPGQVRLERPAAAGEPPPIFDLPAEYGTLKEVLGCLDVRHVHIHHTIGVPEEIFELCHELAPHYDVTLHDYYAICPRIQLIDDSGAYCGEPNETRCNVCLQTNGGYGGIKPEIRAWRADQRRLLAGARKVFVPHADAARRLGRYFPDVPIAVRTHFEDLSAARPVGAAWTPNEPLRVAVIGVLGPHKGSRIIAACARQAWEQQLPLEFHIIGYVDSDPEFPALPNISMTGPYREHEVFDKLAAERCHCAFFASVWPETYCYTLSIALAGRLFPAAFDLGAPAARLRKLGAGHLIPLTQDAVRINAELLQLRERLQTPWPGCADEPTDYPSLRTDYYEFTSGQDPFGLHPPHLRAC